MDRFITFLIVLSSLVACACQEENSTEVDIDSGVASVNELQAEFAKQINILSESVRELKSENANIKQGYDRHIGTLRKNIIELKQENMDLKQQIIRHHTLMVKQQEVIDTLSSDVTFLKKELAENTKRHRRQVETVGFTAYLDHRINTHPDGTLKFNQVLYNDGGAYNVHTGVFTVPITATYIISFQTEDWEGSNALFRLKVDGKNTVDAILDSPGKSTMSGNTAVLRLTAGQSVWVETTEGNAYGNTDVHTTTFCAALLYY